MRSKTKLRVLGRGGFSLFELLIALAVIAVLAALGSSFLSGTMRESAYRAQMTEGRNQLKQVLAQLSTMMSMRDGTSVVASPTSLKMAVPRDQTLPLVYYEVNWQSSCRNAPDGSSGFVLAPESKGQSCYTQLACSGRLPYIEVRHVGHPTKTVERFPSDEQFARMLRSENALAGFGICVQESPDSYTVKGIAAITKPSTGGQGAIQLIEESLILPKLKRNDLNIVPH